MRSLGRILSGCDLGRQAPGSSASWWASCRAGPIAVFAASAVGFPTTSALLRLRE